MIVYRHWIKREDLRANPLALYVFGDNAIHVGFGGQAKEMRGEPNAVGIVTKRTPSVYLKDADFDEITPLIVTAVERLRAHLLAGNGVVVFPAQGIGTGLANLSAQAPRIWTFLRAELRSLEIMTL